MNRQSAKQAHTLGWKEPIRRLSKCRTCKAVVFPGDKCTNPACAMRGLDNSEQRAIERQIERNVNDALAPKQGIL